jgi:hypothetical protein
MVFHTPKGFSKKLHAVEEKNTFRGFSQRAKPYWVGFVICVCEKPLKNPYF